MMDGETDRRGGERAQKGPSRATAKRRRRVGRWSAFVLFVAVVVCAGIVGFLWFVTQLPAQEVALREPADGIVVLTGGASRVSDGMELLAAGQARRLLISGVRPSNSPGDISRAIPEHQSLLSCCVDLGRWAINTRGNAAETRRWAQERGMRSLIVVTSNYHMPRAIAEFSHAMPDVRLVPYPVVGERWRADPWWSGGPTARLLLTEYIKYVFAEVRLRLNASGVLPSADDDTTGGVIAVRKPDLATR